jgi:chromate reductase
MTARPSRLDGAPFRLLGISGSLRRESNNTAVLRTLKEALSGKAEMTLFPLNDIPPYNADHDGENAPEPVRALKGAIAGSDGLVFCSPEYNYGMSGVLKNALDWASRPGFKSPLKDKPALIMTSSPGFTGGVRAQYQLREVLSATLARVVARPQVVIGGVAQKIKEGRLVDEAAVTFALAAIDDLLREIRIARAFAAEQV